MDKCTLIVTLTFLAYLLTSPVKAQNGQPVVNTPCTASMIATFTPCMNYITGSSANGTSPASNCCDAFKSVMGTSVDCACLLVTGGVPLPQLANQALALGLPRFCKGVNVPVQCQASGSPLPPPGPLQFAPPPASSAPSPQGPPHFGAPTPSSAFSPEAASKATTASPIANQPTPQEVAPTAASPLQPAESPTMHRVRPVLTPQTSSASMINLPTIWLLLIGFMIFNL